MRSLVTTLLLAVGCVGVLAAQTVTSGSHVVDLAQIEHLRGRASVAAPVLGVGNVLDNPGFEDGALPPWTTNNWAVTNTDPNSGAFSAEDIGNFFIRQDFAPIDVTTVTAATIFMRQPEAAISQITFFYDGAGEDSFLVFPTAAWSQFDLSPELRGSGDLVGIRIFGYSGGGPDPDLTRIDDVVIDSTLIPVELIGFEVE